MSPKCLVQSCEEKSFYESPFDDIGMCPGHLEAWGDAPERHALAPNEAAAEPLSRAYALEKFKRRLDAEDEWRAPKARPECPPSCGVCRLRLEADLNADEETKR